MSMTTIALLMGLLAPSAQAWTLNNSSRSGYSSSEITVYVSTVGCSSILSTDQVEAYVKEAIDEFWNKVPTSSLKLSYGGTVATSLDGYASASAAAVNTSVNSIVVGCNDDAAEFSSFGVLAVGGITCSGTDCKGAVIFNSAGNSQVPSTSHAQLLGAFAHEFGHALGLGHSSVEEAVMYYSVSGKTQEFLHQDDMDAITYLYPNKKKIGGLAGSCSSVALIGGGDDGPSGPLSFVLNGLLGFLCLGLISRLRRFSALRPQFR